MVTSCLTEAPSLNETFCRALLQASLTEEDIAARLGVDPKTVRRWIEGRALPYRRHRWALATMLDTPETELWPELRSAQPRPAEVVAVYPHLGTVPREVWLRLFGSAEHNISLLDHFESPLARDDGIIAALAERARAGATIRICLADPAAWSAAGQQEAGPLEADADGAQERYAPLRDSGEAEIRLHQGVLYSFMYRADDQILVAQRVHGVPAPGGPVVHLQQATGGDMFGAYVDSFERTWAEARPWTG
jgi:transcriptional regulator with XRE-family HTH domain